MKTSNEIASVNREEGRITRKELMGVFWRSFTINASFNYERQMSQGFVFSMMPVLKKLYPERDDLADALVRHSEFFNVTPMLSPFTMGIVSAMEEENAKSNDFDVNSINAVKASLMGPLSGIGDSIFWGHHSTARRRHCLLACPCRQRRSAHCLSSDIQRLQRCMPILWAVQGL